MRIAKLCGSGGRISRFARFICLPVTFDRLAPHPTQRHPFPAFADQETVILQELIDCQGSPVDIGGYYHPLAAMRPSATLNVVLAMLG